VTRRLTGDWVLASTNPGKLAEFRTLLAGTDIRLVPLARGADVPEETGSTFVENAIIKARHAALSGASRALADDSGLCVDALGGAPGVISARYAGPQASDADNIERLLRELEGARGAGRRAEFHCVVVALSGPDDPAPLIATGRWQGEIALAPRGLHGFGYDPVFLDSDTGLTAAELEPARKNRISHRARACAELNRLLET
jgi:XTP/dITP diphosphohydrolase